MTREEITSYRPAQDPPIDPSQGQAPVQVSTNLAVEPRPPPRAPVMSTAEIAAYRSGEDPAYDPVERRGWWEVDMASGRPLSILSEHKGTKNNCFLQGKNAKCNETRNKVDIMFSGFMRQVFAFSDLLLHLRSCTFAVKDLQHETSQST